MQSLQAQGRDPHIGYVYPAGGQCGTTFEILVGGQYLDGTKGVLVSGQGVRASFVSVNKPITSKRFDELRNYLEEAKKKPRDPAKPVEKGKPLTTNEKTAQILKESGATDDEIKSYIEVRKQRSDPKRQQNLQISETVTLKIEIAADAPIGYRQIRLLKPTGVTNPLHFCIGQFPELVEDASNDKSESRETAAPLPAILNGQILPGEVDRYSFHATRGTRLVVAAQGRDLIPYLADAVPGWFQPALTLYDPKGNKVAFENHFYFSTDPVIYYEVPAEGDYHLEIRDMLYRGREDFVYRVTLGEVRYVRDIFPLGGQSAVPVSVSVSGWNLSCSKIMLTPPAAPGIYPVNELGNGFVTRNVLFASDPLPQLTEVESSSRAGQAQRVSLPMVINGKINSPGDDDIFAINCRADETVVAEVYARRLNSPLDSWLRVTDSTGQQIAFNDDCEDKGAGLLTQAADSRLSFTALTAGIYYIHLGDTQGVGGPEYAYRLRLSAPMPDFTLYSTPSSLNGRAGSCLPLTVHAVRKDGFSGEIHLTLKSPTDGFSMDGGKIPAGQDKVRVTINLPPVPSEKPIYFAMEGRATISNSSVIRQVKAADDMIQAFMYHQLVPAVDWIAIVSGPPSSRPPIKLVTPSPVKLKTGAETKLVVALDGRNPFVIAETQLQLIEAPDGISISGISAVPEGMAISIKAEPSKVKSHFKGNLIIEVFNEKTFPASKDKPATTRRYSMGLLPAIPFEIHESR